jgi:hypothetical protein
MEKYLGLVLCGAILLSGCGSGGSSTASIVERLTISTASLPNATWELPYSQMVQTSGGVAPFTWTVSAGALPFNLALGSTTNNAVTISGTPVAVAQGVAFTIKVTDSANQSATQSYTVSTLLGPDTLTFSPQGLNFGMQPVGTTTAKQSETLTNTGSQELIINSVATIGTDAMDFNQSGGCGSSLAAGANCTLFMTFTPSFTGPRSASISIDDNSTGSATLAFFDWRRCHLRTECDVIDDRLKLLQRACGHDQPGAVRNRQQLRHDDARHRECRR